MRLEWIEDILAVAEAGSLLKAAERRYLTQSAFSRRIKVIENQLGTELFDRSQKPVKLRAHVLERLPEMVELAARLRNLAADLRDQGQQSKERIVIASQHAITTSIVPHLIQALSHSHELDVRLRSANRDESYALLFTRQADIVLMYATDRHPLMVDNSFVELHVLGSERLTPVFAADRMDALEADLARDELPVVAYPEGVFLGKVLREEIWPRLPDMSFKSKAETALTLAALQFAIIGMAVAWVPETLARPHILSGEVVDLSGRLGHQPLSLTAIRVKGTRSAVEQAAWGIFVSQGAQLLSDTAVWSAGPG